VQLSDEIIFFDDVAGAGQAKVELLEVVDFFKWVQRAVGGVGVHPDGLGYQVAAVLRPLLCQGC
jgi:ATP-dependent Zn protease